MKLENLLQGIEIENIYNLADIDIKHITNNSRECVEGSLFVAVKGYQTDGHRYILSAVENGAVAVICEEYNPSLSICQIVVKSSRRAESLAAANFYGRPSSKFSLIGVTGTNGKTTVTYLVKHILDSLGYKTGLIGTNQNIIGDKILDTARTTPDSIELQGIFSKMAKEKVDYCIMEVSSHALELDRIYGCRFLCGAFTNLTQDHLDFHLTMENYAKAKSKLFEISDNAVINIDDPKGEVMLPKNGSYTCTYSAKGAGSVNAQNIELSSDGVSFEADDMSFTLGIPGEFSVYNALCAIAIAKTIGVSYEDIRRAIATAHGVKGRAEVVKTNTDYTVIIDYAHTPDGVENILKTVKGFARGRTIIVFGCGGDRDNTKRAIMGSVAGKLADFSVITSDNPRTENPMKIIAMIEEGIKKLTDNYVVIENRREAIAYAMENAKAGDVIVLAGKGHETYQILNDGTIHFDEREVVADILANK